MLKKFGPCILATRITQAATDEAAGGFLKIGVWARISHLIKDAQI